MRRPCLLAIMALTAAAVLSGCDDPVAQSSGTTPGTSGATSTGSAAAATPKAPKELAVSQGSAIARDLSSRYLAIADEDHTSLRVVTLPLKTDSAAKTLALPGPPAQLIHREGQLLVTIRNPSLLLAFATGGSSDPATWKESWRAKLPNDAWGLAVDAKQKSAYVSSAWGHHVSAVSLADGKIRWSLDVAREPRGLLVLGDDLYVNHLVGREITRLSGVAGDKPELARHDLPPAPLRTPLNVEPSASLGYALAASPDGRRLFVPRHALGVLGEWKWYGASTVDVFHTKTLKPVLGKPRPRRATSVSKDVLGWTIQSPATKIKGGPTLMATSEARQPRHIVYRKKTDTLLVVSEGENVLMEMDALVPAPSAAVLENYSVGYEQRPVFEFPMYGGAPSGIALSEDETTAWVYCRSTDDLVKVVLDSERLLPRAPALSDEEKAKKNEEAKKKAEAEKKAKEEAKKKKQAAAKEPPKPMSALQKMLARKSKEPLMVRLVDAKVHADPDDPQVQLMQMGRATYFQAASERIGQGVACASCHPDGRDDGFVWREVHFAPLEKDGDEGRRLASNPVVLEATHKWGLFRGGADYEMADPLGGARQTPMLAGRLESKGPYGWRAQSDTLPERVAHGFELHRTQHSKPHKFSKGETGYFSAAVAMFLRKGLRPPARDEHPLTEQEKQGQKLFMDANVGCGACHAPKTHYSDGAVYPKIVKPTAGYTDEKNINFRTPSLAFVSGTPPYFHDGSRSTLENVIKYNMDRMGKTTQLSDDDRAALVAFLRTL
jgi:cytochrome c peroxidase